MNRIPNVICRGNVVAFDPALAGPFKNVGAPSSANRSGMPKKGVLKMLRASHRIWVERRSLIFTFLNIAKSARLKCGARRVLRPTPNGVPNTLSAFRLLMMNWTWSGVTGVGTGLPIVLKGTSLTGVPQEKQIGVIGRPVAQR